MGTSALGSFQHSHVAAPRVEKAHAAMGSSARWEGVRGRQELGMSWKRGELGISVSWGGERGISMSRD